LTLTEAADSHTLITVAGTYEVVGRVATLGAGMIRQKADKIIEEFRTQAAAALGGV
jgi:carbon monoxide dehydrogenase subunit G